MSIGCRIKQLREQLGIPQTELARMVGITKQSLYKYESSIITNIPSNKIEAIAKKLNTTPAYLMGWETTNNSTLCEPTEKKLVQDYRSLSDQGKEYILQTMDMAVNTYRKQPRLPKESSYSIAAWGADETETVQPPIDEITT